MMICTKCVYQKVRDKLHTMAFRPSFMKSTVDQDGNIDIDY